MSSLPVKVTVVERPIYINAKDNTPTQINIAEQGTTVKVLNSNPVVTVKGGGNPTINVALTGGRGPVWLPGQTADVKEIVHLMRGLVTELEIEETFLNRINLTHDTLQAYVNLFDSLFGSDGSDYHNVKTYLSQTGASIDQIALDVSVHDHNITALMSEISQQATKINLAVTSLKDLNDPGGFIDYASSHIAIAAEQIAMQSQQITDMAGMIDSKYGEFIVSADSIYAHVNNIEGQANTGFNDIKNLTIEHDAHITLLADSIELGLMTVNTQTNELYTATQTLTAANDLLALHVESLDSTASEMTAIRSMMANYFGITVTEDNQGNKMISGFKMLVHQNWILEAHNYAIGDTCWYIDSAYKCILAHESNNQNNPVAGIGVYWQLIPEEDKSVFSIDANNFVVSSVSGTNVTPKKIFLVDADSGEITLNASMIVGGDLRSANFSDALKTGYELSHNTGTAKFYNIQMQLTSTSDLTGVPIENFHPTFVAFSENAAAAAANADYAMSRINDITSDTVIDPSEKSALLQEYNILIAEQAQLVDRANQYSIITERNAYNTAITALTSYCLPYISDPSTAAQLPDSTTFNSKFTDVYAAKNNLLTKILEKSGILITATAVDVADALGRIDDITDDSIIDPSEKPALLQEYDILVAEQANLVTKATQYGIITEKNNYSAAMSALISYCPQYMANPTISTQLPDSTTFKTKFSNAYKTKSILLARMIESAGLSAVWSSVSNIPTDKIYANDAATTLGFNPSFEKWTGALPDGWSNWSGASPTKETTIVRYGSNSVKMVCPGGATQAVGLHKAVMWNTAPLPLGSFVAGTIDFYIASAIGVGKPAIYVVLYYNSSEAEGFIFTPDTSILNAWQKIPFSCRLKGAARRICGVRIYILGTWSATNYYQGTCYVDGLTFHIFDAAIDNATLGYNGSTTTIDGGKIHADSSISIGQTANVAGNRYCLINGGDITFYDYYNSQFNAYKSLSKIVTGTCAHNATTNIGYWRVPPKVMVSPNSITTYKPSGVNQEQSLQLSASVTHTGGNIYQFTPVCRLVFGTGGYTQTAPAFNTVTVRDDLVDAGGSYGWWEGTSTATSRPTTRSVTVNFDWSTQFAVQPGSASYEYDGIVYFKLKYYTNGWYDGPTVSLAVTPVSRDMLYTGSSTVSCSASTDILYIKMCMYKTYGTAWRFSTSNVFSQRYTDNVMTCTSATLTVGSSVAEAVGTLNYVAIGG